MARQKINGWGLLGLALALWGLWALRAYEILALPVFVDESLHILRAQVVFEFSDPAASFMPGKLLLYYYLGAFGLENHQALWLSRVAISLLAPLSAAFCFAIIRQMTRSAFAGLFAVLLYALSPALIFFERMALADPLMGVLMLGLIWSSLCWAKKTNQGETVITPHPCPDGLPLSVHGEGESADALASRAGGEVKKNTLAFLTGLLLGGALLAKLTALPLIIAPLWALFCLHPNKPRPFLARLPHKKLIIMYGVAGLLLMPPFMYVAYQSLGGTENKGEVVTTSLFIPESRSRIGQVAYNAETYASALAYLGGAALLFSPLILIAIWKRPGQSAYLGGMAAALIGFLLLASAFPSTRYLAPALPPLLLLIALGGHEINRMLPPTLHHARLAALILLVGMSADFIQDAWRNPAALRLNDQDTWEYFSNLSSGYIQEVAATDLIALADDAPIFVAGYMGHCHSLRLYWPADDRLKLHCPYFPFFGLPSLMTLDEWENARAVANIQTVYYLIEERPDEIAPTPDPATWHLIATYASPHEGASAQLYEVRLAEND